MEEEFEQEESISIQTETQTSVNEETKQTLDSLPRIEELRKSEQEVKFKTQIEGTADAVSQSFAKDRVFTRKSDEKKVFIKKRLKIVTAVYTSVVVLLLSFVVGNIATMAILDRQINANTKTIQSQKEQIVKVLEESNPGQEIGDFQISLNEPRDYSEDKKELTWLDKITILFRNIFS